MSITWVAGNLESVPIEWLHVEGICEVKKDAELLTVKISGITDGLTDGGYFDNFILLKNLLEEKLTGNEVVYLPIDEATTEMPVFGAVVEIAQIMAAHIMPKQTITGSDTDTMTLKLVNKETGAVICTKTFLAGADALAYEVTDFGPVNEGNNAINYGKGVSLVKEGGGTLPQALIIVEWNLG